MIKHPALRVLCIEDVSPAFLGVLLTDLESWGKMTPFTDLIVDFEVVGSYARGCARFGSDLDINVATSDIVKAKELIQSNKDPFRMSIRFLRSLSVKYGLRIEAALQHETVANTPKSYFSLRKMKMVKGEKMRIDFDEKTKEIHYRNVNPNKQHFDLKHFNEEAGEWERFIPNMHDPWLELVPQYREMYGKKFLEIGKTSDTDWL